MEYLVTMTTHVPDGTSDTAVEDMRARRGGPLAGVGRGKASPPPLATSPAAGRMADARTLRCCRPGRARVSAPLHAPPGVAHRRSRPTVAASERPRPANQARRSPRQLVEDSEFFTIFTITVPSGTPRDVIDATEANEADRAGQLAALGKLRRLWALSGEGRALGLWRASGDGEMQTILESLPLRGWSDVETVRLAPHPSDARLDPR